MQFLDWRDVHFAEGFLAERVKVNGRATIPAVWQHTKETGRADVFKLEYSHGGGPKPHHFWDSDLAKWIEAAAYDLAREPNAETEANIDRIVDDMAAAQQPDGYLNSFFIQVCPDQRWTNLRDMHELYCAGHLMEAAVAYFNATGKRQFLDVMCRYADHIEATFGPAPGKTPGYPGHEEIELALIRLFEATGEVRYRDLAAFFVTERGKQPHYYTLEAERRGQTPADYRHRTYDYNQAHALAVNQSTAEGHAVRACYFYAGMADVARESGRDDLAEAARVIWRNIVGRRMYVTGAVGSEFNGERFTVDHDLPNETSYAETCAQIALVFFARRMLMLEANSEYADVMELVLYNSILSGVSLDGERIFYINPHAMHRDGHRFDPRGGRLVAERPEWHGCACCPANLARLFASLGGYLCSTDEGRLYIHLYAGCDARAKVSAGDVAFTMRTDYPFDGEVAITITEAPETEFALCLRQPGWAVQADVAVNNETVSAERVGGYLQLRRRWRSGDRILLSLPMMAAVIEAHPAVRHNAGRVALKRGPLVYCMESVDNGPDLDALELPACAQFEVVSREIAGLAVPVLVTQGFRLSAEDWGDALYRPAGASQRKQVTLTAIPYFMWANRGANDMLIWIRRQS